MCCQWWQRCTYPAFEVQPSVYMSLKKFTISNNFKNLSLTVIDNLFDVNKAQILYNLLAESSVKGFSFVNLAMPIDFR
jgi:hypothetical protein